MSSADRTSCCRSPVSPGRLLLGSLLLLLALATAPLACERERTRDAAASESMSSGAADARQAPPPRTRLDERPTLVPEREIQFRLADFAQPNEPQIVLVELSIKGARNERPADLDERILTILGRRIAAPWILKSRANLERDERPVARAHFTFRKVIDRFKKRGKSAPRRGKLRFEADLQTRLPRGHQSNWDSWRLKGEFERPLEQLLAMDPELLAAIERELPTFAVVDLESARDFVRNLDLRDELVRGELHAVLDRELFAIFRGGCVGVATDRGIDVFLLQDLARPALSLEPNPNVTVRCTPRGAFVAIADTPRAVRVEYHPFSPVEQGWQSRASFTRAIDPATMRFLASGQTLCLVGEHREHGRRHAKVQCYDVATGERRWEWTEPGTDLAAVAVRQGVLILATGRHVRMLDIESGERLFSAEVPHATGLTGNTQSCLLGDRFIFAHSVGRFMALDLKTRTVDWQVNTYGGNFAYCDEAGRIYFDEVGGELIAVTDDTLEPRWRFRVADRIVDALFHGGYLFVLMPRALYALDAETGKVAWQLGLDVEATGLHRHNRRLYLVGKRALYELTRQDRL